MSGTGRKIKLAGVLPVISGRMHLSRGVLADATLGWAGAFRTAGRTAVGAAVLPRFQSLGHLQPHLRAATRTGRAVMRRLFGGHRDNVACPVSYCKTEHPPQFYGDHSAAFTDR